MTIGLNFHENSNIERGFGRRDFDTVRPIGERNRWGNIGDGK